jgi:hypothetical protein
VPPSPAPIDLPTSRPNRGADPIAGASLRARDGDGELTALVEAWIAHDPDPARRTELRALLDDGPHDELADRFRGSLRFGTAGLRGAIGAGPSRMSVATVRGASAGRGVAPASVAASICPGTSTAATTPSDISPTA